MRNSIMKLGSALILAGFVFANGACTKEDEPTPPSPSQKTIAQIAADDGDFSILVDALSRTGLLATVSDNSANLTVFAPTNQAFADLLAELNLPDLDAVENALGTEGLKTVVLYHVLGMEVKSNMVSTGYVSTAAVNSTDDALSLFINTMSGVKINNRAMVTTPDVDASNGVIHIIDKVILPLSIYDLLMVNPDYSSLTTALGVADGNLDALLADIAAGPFTVFGPDNMAFGDLLTELNLADLPAVVASLGTDGLADVLLYHVVPGNINSDEVPSGMVTTASSEMFSIDMTAGVAITDKNNRTGMVKVVDIQGTNGVIHTIDKVLLP